LLHERAQLIGAAMQVAKDVERADLVLLVVPQGNPADLDLLSVVQNVNVAEALPL
jgi:hypothetical protein